MKKGKVYIIGAGPGDEELITVKGLKRLQEADVILYDFLTFAGFLKYAKPGAELICVGKADGIHLVEQGKINKLLYKKAAAGKKVVRLKGGDPLVFSRGIEEALFLKKRNVEFEIIQGITSAFAAPESFGIPLTRRGKFDSIAILTGRKSNGEELDAPDCDTLVYLMAVASIREVIAALLKSGRDKSTPCAFIEKGTTAEKRITTGNLGNIIKKAKNAQVVTPAVFIVGEVVRYGKRVHEGKDRK